MGPTDDILPDEILDKHLGGRSPAPAAGSTSIAADLDDTGGDDADLEAELDDTDEDEVGGDELDDAPDEDDADSDDDDTLDDDEDDEDLDDEEDDDLDDDETEEDDEDEDEKPRKGSRKSKSKKPKDFLENVTREERERIEKDPVLKKLHRKMQADYTRKTTEVARLRKETEALRASQQQFMDELRTPEGAVKFVRDVALADPYIAAAAFEKIATGDGAKDFLVEVGLQMYDQFAEAWDRIQELHDDPDERRRHEERREDEREEAERKRRRAERERERFRERMDEIRDEAARLATKAGLDPEDAEEVWEEIKAEVRRRIAAREPWDLSRDEVKRIVRAVRKDIRRREERIAKRLERQQLREQRERVKKRARNATRRRAVPRTSSGAGARGRMPEPPPNKDPLDHFIDTRFDL